MHHWAGIFRHLLMNNLAPTACANSISVVVAAALKTTPFVASHGMYVRKLSKDIKTYAAAVLREENPPLGAAAIEANQQYC